MQSLLRDQDTLERGIEQGASEKEIEIAKNGLENNVPIETISVMTGLSIEEIKKLKKMF